MPDDTAPHVLTPGAVEFVTTLHRRFNPTRLALLERRAERQRQLDGGLLPGFLPETESIRRADRRVASAPPDLEDRRVEITGPAERKMMINLEDTAMNNNHFSKQAQALLAEARAKLAAYLGADADDLVYFPNPTTAVNMVARSLELKPGDEVLTTDHEYGAMDRTWKFLSRKQGFSYVRRPIPLPVTTHEDFVEQFWGGVTPRTRVIFVSHITSATALTFPAKELCRRARDAGLISIVDGAHVPGQIPLNLAELGADYYTGACHKWLCAPKGSAFLVARRGAQARLDPLVISWGWGDEEYAPMPGLGNTPFISFHEWQGTRDPAAFLATPAAIQFQAEHHWEAARAECRELASETRERINALTGLDSICPDSPEWFTQFAAIRLPDSVDVNEVKQKLYDEYCIEVPLYKWNEQNIIRVSIPGYNSREDADVLVKALSHHLNFNSGRL